MMALRLLFVAFALAVSVHADLTCLEWGLLLTPLGLWCHFKHDSFNAAENASVAAAESMATEVKDAAVFTVKHHPLVLEYDYVETAIENGTAAANSQLRGQLHDEVKVGIGMGKELANTAVNIYELAHWDDLTFCLMQSAQEAALMPEVLVGNVTYSDLGTTGHQGTSSRLPVNIGTEKVKRAKALSTSQAEVIFAKCTTRKLQQLAKPAVFNITDSNEKIGSTLTQLASFFVPIGSESEGAKLALNTVDLAIPGAEDAGRIFQKVGEESSHFESEADALLVKQHLDEPSWVEKNCNTCRPPLLTAVGRRKRRHHVQTLRKTKRGNTMSLCCALPVVPPGSEETVHEVPSAKGLSGSNSDSGVNDLKEVSVGQEGLVKPAAKLPLLNSNKLSATMSPEELKAELGFDPTDLWSDSGEDEGYSSDESFRGPPRVRRPLSEEAHIEESVLTPAPKLHMWTDSAADEVGIMHDLADHDTAVLAWSKDATDVISSDELFVILRRAFNPVTAEDRILAEELYIQSERNSFRLGSWTKRWKATFSTHPDMQKIQLFAEAAVEQIEKTVQDLRKLTTQELNSLNLHMDIYYIPPTKLAVNNPDPRGLHIDANILQFGIADQPGLIISSKDKMFRVPTEKNAWHLLKCTRWRKMGLKPAIGEAFHPTAHTVFGPEIVQHGRISIIVNAG